MARRPLNSKRIALNHEALFAAADKRQAATRRAIVRALDVAYRSVTNAEATAAWKQSPNALMRAIDWDGVAEAMGAQPGTYGVYKADTAGTLFGQTYLSGARVAVDGMEQQLGQTIGLNLTVDQSIAYGQQRAGALISGIQQSQLSAVRDTLGLALEQGIDVGSTGRILRGSVGLSPRQATALANYERGLTELYTTGRTNVTLRGLGRPLADARYSLDKLSEARIEEMVDRYRERLVNYRAEMIARTELARSANQGAYEEQMSHAADGLFGARSANRIWLTTPDDRLCEDCDAMDGQTISFLDSFEYDAGADDEEPGAGETIIMDVPPLHPNCRCTTILEITDESMEEAFAADTDINDLVDFQGFDEEAFVDDVVADEPMSAEMNDQYVGVGPMSDDDVVSFLYDNVELLDPSRSGLDYYATELPHGKTYRGIANAQGFDGAAALGTAEDLAAEVARGGTAIYRGVAEATHVDAYVNGTMFGSTGMSGTGAYFSTSIDEAFMYAGGAIEDTTITAVLRADARTITYDDAVSLMEQQRRSLAERLMMTEPAEGWESLTLEQRTQMGMDSFFMSNAQTDVGNVAAMNGYDAIIRTNAQTKESHVIVLNRTALVIQS